MQAITSIDLVIDVMSMQVDKSTADATIGPIECVIFLQKVLIYNLCSSC